MSKSNPRKDGKLSPIIFGEGFPVGRSVSGCYLKKIDKKKKCGVMYLSTEYIYTSYMN